MFGFRRTRWNIIRFITVTLCILLLLNQLSYLSGLSSEPPLGEAPNDPPEVIVSLATTTQRARRGELRVTLQSLLAQTVLPSAIHVYVSERDALWFKGQLDAVEDSEKGPTNRFPRRELKNPLVQLNFVEDVGPATKFVHVLAAAFDGEPLSDASSRYTNDTESEEGKSTRPLPDPAIIVCDDDHIYSPTMIETLLRWHRIKPHAAIGFRGWRVRRDLKWGVSAEEYNNHVIQGDDIASPYRVGVLTANEAYLLLPSFFSTSPKSSTPPYDPAILDFSPAPKNARFVDDIWMNGHLALAQVERWVVPCNERSNDITQFHTLEKGMEGAHVTRAGANDEVIGYFGKAWEPDIFYKFGGVNPPRWASLPTRAYRKLKAFLRRSAWANGMLEKGRCVGCGF
ncbi:hypothetical protein HDV00_009507 [Rhizophlyctis rosea]|nr:hypothetical protein HDV00_009507 [Rhizophlyctis rosea]